MIKGGAQRLAAEHGLMLVAPDTSPRGLGTAGRGRRLGLRHRRGLLPRRHRRTLLAPLQDGYLRHARTAAGRGGALPRSDARGIFGHSMGGHGALTLALKTRTSTPRSRPSPPSPPPCAPLGKEGVLRATWAPTKSSGASTTPASWCAGVPSPTAGPYSWTREPQTSSSRSSSTRRSSKKACREAGQPLTLRWHEGYDHGYYFISTFMEDHLRHHAEALVGAA